MKRLAFFVFYLVFGIVAGAILALLPPKIGPFNAHYMWGIMIGMISFDWTKALWKGVL